MYSTITPIRIRYGETDKMGIVYYGNYALFYEQARTEMMRELGVVYAELEQNNIMMPVIEYHIEYKKSAYYDEIIQVETTIQELPKAKVTFHYRTFNDQNELLNTGYVSLAFINCTTNRPTKCPEIFLEALKRNIH